MQNDIQHERRALRIDMPWSERPDDRPRAVGQEELVAIPLGDHEICCTRAGNEQANAGSWAIDVQVP